MARNAASTDVTNDWHPARLIPAFGIRGQHEQEKRATASLLAVMHAVPEFANALLGPLGAPKCQPDTFCEVQLKDAAGNVHIPDGALIATRGQRVWRCLVEVKTDTRELDPAQVDRYLDLAREHRFDAVLTISNQITGSVTESPVDVDRRKLRSVKLCHLSWWRILTEAIIQHRHRGVSDPDQAWLLGELIAYLDDDRSGASGFQDMGEKWVTVRDGARQRTLRASDGTVRGVAERWDQFVDYLCLGLSQNLGADVKRVRSRKQTAAVRHEAAAIGLADNGVLTATIKVPDAVGPITVEADLRTRRVTTRVEVDASGDTRPLTRINWLLRQLKQAPDGLLIEASFVNAKTTTAALLNEARVEPRRLLSADPKRLPRAFRLSLSRPMGTKRGKGERSFVQETRHQAIDFYRDLVQDLRPWRRAAPKLPDEPDDDSAEREPAESLSEPGPVSNSEAEKAPEAPGSSDRAPAPTPSSI